MARNSFSFSVFGVHPATQGSKKYVGTRRTATGNNIPLIVESHPGLPKFRKAITDAIVDSNGENMRFVGAVKISATFYLPKPKTSSNRFPVNQRSGDLDKYLRALMDAVTKSELWGDDSQVVEIEAYKLYAMGEPGVIVTITAI